MAAYEFLPPYNFLGLPRENSGYEQSQAIVLPVPYEATTSYKGGTKEGPRAILEASHQVELFDVEFGFEPALHYGIHTLPFLAPDLHSPEVAVASIAAAVADFANSGKLLCVLGGEHALSIGVARGLHEALGDFVTVQLDAHADLRDLYEGTPYSHACAARRIVEISPVVQAGIRSLDITEDQFRRANPDLVTTFFASDMHQDPGYLDRLVAQVAGKRVFLTVDLDVLDPAFMPSTGTPEPGGIDWYELLRIVRALVDHCDIIAFDCVELSPIPALHAPNFLAAKLVYKILSLVLDRRHNRSS